MSDDMRSQLYDQFVAAQYKYAYFILTAAGAGIALAISNTNSVNLGYSQIPLGCAVLSWLTSFYSGCRFIMDRNSTLYSSLLLIIISDGVHPVAGDNPNMQKELSNQIENTLKESDGLTARRGSRQFRFLVVGAALYLIWHIVEMLMRSLS